MFNNVWSQFTSPSISTMSSSLSSPLMSTAASTSEMNNDSHNLMSSDESHQPSFFWPPSPGVGQQLSISADDLEIYKNLTIELILANLSALSDQADDNNTANHLPSQSSSAGQSNASIITRIVAYSIIFIAAFVGNVLVIATLVLSRRMRTVTNVFLTNLAISDLLLGIFCMPFTLVGSIARNFVFGSTMCKLIPYLQAISVGVSAWTLVAISLERYFAICHPLESRKWQTISHAKRIIFLIWFFNFILMSPIAILSKLLPTKIDGKFKCREVWPSDFLEEFFNLSLDVILLLVPFVIMVVTYAQISRTLCQSGLLNNKFDDHHQHPQNKPHTNVMTNGNNSRRLINRWPPPASDDEDEDDDYTTTVGGQEQVTGLTHPSQGEADSRTDNGPASSVAVFYNCRRGDVSVVNVHGKDGTSSDENRPQQSVSENPSPRQMVQAKARFGHSRRCQAQVLSKKRIIRMLCVLVLEFFLCWTPIYVVNTWALYNPKQIYSFLGPTAISFIHLLAYVSSCTNPITYCFMHRKFREALLTMIRCRDSHQGYVISELELSTSNPSAGSTTVCQQQHLHQHQQPNHHHHHRYRRRRRRWQPDSGGPSPSSVGQTSTTSLSVDGTLNPLASKVFHSQVYI